MMMLKEGAVGRAIDIDKTYGFVKGALQGARMRESLRALQYMRDKHRNTPPRSDGQPYEAHPLEMTRLAISLESEFITDTTMATILLHDVPEETNSKAEELPFSNEVRRGVKYMTITSFKNETNFEKKRRYANELLECWDSTVCKGLDMFVNLKSMKGTFAPDKVRKNVVETDLLRLPVLKEAQRQWSDRSALIFILREMVKAVNDNLAMDYGVRLTDPMFQNAPDARDYSFLVTGAPAPDWYIPEL